MPRIQSLIPLTCGKILSRHALKITSRQTVNTLSFQPHANFSSDNKLNTKLKGRTQRGQFTLTERLPAMSIFYFCGTAFLFNCNILVFLLQVVSYYLPLGSFNTRRLIRRLCFFLQVLYFSARMAFFRHASTKGY